MIAWLRQSVFSIEKIFKSFKKYTSKQEESDCMVEAISTQD